MDRVLGLLTDNMQCYVTSDDCATTVLMGTMHMIYNFPCIWDTVPWG